VDRLGPPSSGAETPPPERAYTTRGEEPGPRRKWHGFDVVLDAAERVPDRPFTDPAETDADAWIMGDMLRQQRAMARAWRREQAGGAFTDERVEAGWRELVVVPDRPALLEAADVTAVGFFGQLSPDTDHGDLFAHERNVVATLGASAAAGFLSYFDLGPEHGRYGNLILFWTPQVPEEWHASPAHLAAVAAAPEHYLCIRLHKGRIPGPFLGVEALRLERTTYLQFGDAGPWRGLRLYGSR
jgi:hypothetical protein